jgi:GGDEF domain-containing protein
MTAPARREGRHKARTGTPGVLPADLDVTDAATGVMNAIGWEAALRLEEDRAARYGERPAVLLVDLDDAGEPPEATVARALAVVTGAIRSSDRVARVTTSRLAVLAAGGGPQAAYLAERLRLSLAMEGVPPAAIRTRSRDQYGDLTAAWRAAVTNDAAASEASPRRPRRSQPRLRDARFLEGLISELRLDLALVAGVARRLERRHRPDLIELGALLRRHAERVESFVTALELMSGRQDHRPKLVDPAAILRAACAHRGITPDAGVRWAVIRANPARLRAGFEALLEAVAPPGKPPPAVGVSGSGLTLIFSTSGDLLDDARRNWRLRLARRFIEHEGGHLRVRRVPVGLQVQIHFREAGPSRVPHGVVSLPTRDRRKQDVLPNPGKGKR